jgi:multidrug efflux pump subunit AcrA (membrane-fusion protein)
VPSSAIVNQTGGQFVKVVTDPKKLTYTSVPVQTGLEADGGLTEITSGLAEGQEIITYMK